MDKNRAARLASTRDWRNGVERVHRARVCVRSFASVPDHEIRTGGQDDGRRDALGNRAVTRATQPRTRPRIPREYVPSSNLCHFSFSFVHPALS